MIFVRSLGVWGQQYDQIRITSARLPALSFTKQVSLKYNTKYSPVNVIRSVNYVADSIADKWSIENITEWTSDEETITGKHS